jgi:uncharacterized protein YidB (DUF937 family)
MRKIDVEAGQFVTFADNPACSGVVFEVNEGIAGLRELSQKLKDMGCGEETHEPVDNLRAVSALKIGDKVHIKSDGPAYSGTVFEFQDNGQVAGLQELSQKLKNTGCGEQTHEMVENLVVVHDEDDMGMPPRMRM